MRLILRTIPIVVVAACGGRESSTEPVKNTAAAIGAPVPECQGRRFITYSSSGSFCTQLENTLASPDWQARPLFPPMPWESSPPGSLANYCVFEWAPPPGTIDPGVSALLTQLSGMESGISVAQDCPKLMMQSSFVDSQTPAFEQQFGRWQGG